MNNNHMQLSAASKLMSEYLIVITINLVASQTGFQLQACRFHHLLGSCTIEFRFNHLQAHKNRLYAKLFGNQILKIVLPNSIPFWKWQNRIDVL